MLLVHSSFDAVGSNEPARDKSIPCINATNLYKQQMEHGFYVKYLGEDVVQFPSGQVFRVIADHPCDKQNYDRIEIGYYYMQHGEMHKAELEKKAEAAKAENILFLLLFIYSLLLAIIPLLLFKKRAII